MDKGLLDLHSVLRWVILLLLLITLFQAFAKSNGIRSTSLWLMISAHTTLLVGLYLWFTGSFGWKILQNSDFGTVMKNSPSRFWVVEHPLSMIIAIILITIARRKAKALNYKATGWLLFFALILILAAVPWPFRDVVGRHWFPGM